MLQVLYYVLVARTYRVTDMSASYPLMRGCAPILVALVGTVFLGERQHAVAWCGIALICAGILCMARGGARQHLWLPLLNAGVIATYTLVDAWGARQSGAALSYTLWLFLLSGLPLPLWAVCTRGPRLWAYARENAGFGVVGGIGTLTSYGLALWAMTIAPVAMISALRETSILFGILISAFVLRERVTRMRWIAAGLIVAASIAPVRNSSTMSTARPGAVRAETSSTASSAGAALLVAAAGVRAPSLSFCTTRLPASTVAATSTAARRIGRR